MNYRLFKISLLALTINLFSLTVLAQGAYLNINAGYGLKMSSQYISTFSFYNNNQAQAFITSEQIYVSFGKGFNAGGALGYLFNNNLGAELSGSYLVGSSYSARKVDDDKIIDMALSSQMFRISPSLVILAGFEKINPYAKFGIIASTGKIIFEEIRSYPNGNEQLRKMKLNKGVAWGLSSCIGVKIKMNDKLSFFGELNMVNLSYSPLKGEITEFIQEDESILDSLSDYERYAEYVDSFTSNRMGDDNKPATRLKQTFPFGSFGASVGLSISF